MNTFKRRDEILEALRRASGGSFLVVYRALSEASRAAIRATEQER